ncbi:MAG: BrxA/BrxB family bacilliredoxin [Candidatus Zixiibacteriota bacterium]
MSMAPFYTTDDIRRLLQAMRDELTWVGIKELRTADDVENAFRDTTGTVLLVVNSVCGCAAGNARPGVALALQNQRIPDRLYTVFAGQDVDATMRARAFMPEQPPSSPSFLLFRDGKLIWYMHRHLIEGRDAQAVAADLIAAFNEHCSAPGPSVSPDIFAQSPTGRFCGSRIPMS